MQRNVARAHPQGCHGGWRVEVGGERGLGPWCLCGAAARGGRGAAAGRGGGAAPPVLVHRRDRCQGCRRRRSCCHVSLSSLCPASKPHRSCTPPAPANLSELDVHIMQRPPAQSRRGEQLHPHRIMQPGVATALTWRMGSSLLSAVTRPSAEANSGASGLDPVPRSTPRPIAASVSSAPTDCRPPLASISACTKCNRDDDSAIVAQAASVSPQQSCHRMHKSV